MSVEEPGAWRAKLASYALGGAVLSVAGAVVSLFGAFSNRGDPTSGEFAGAALGFFLFHLLVRLPGPSSRAGSPAPRMFSLFRSSERRSLERRLLMRLGRFGFPSEISDGVLRTALVMAEDEFKELGARVNYDAPASFDLLSLERWSEGDVLAALRSEGCTDREIRNFRSIPLFERCVITKFYEITIGAAYRKERTVGLRLDPETSLKALKAKMPFFGHPLQPDHPNFIGEDRKLPLDLQPRVFYWIKERGANPYDLDGVPNVPPGQSVNSFIREEIIAGRCPPAPSEFEDDYFARYGMV